VPDQFIVSLDYDTQRKCWTYDVAGAAGARNGSVPGGNLSVESAQQAATDLIHDWRMVQTSDWKQRMARPGFFCSVEAR
jgi:hypothetical protein